MVISPKADSRSGSRARFHHAAPTVTLHGTASRASTSRHPDNYPNQRVSVALCRGKWGSVAISACW